MPYIRNPKHQAHDSHLEPHEAIDIGHCPECGRDLSIHKSTPARCAEAEIQLHWPAPEDPNQDQSERKYRIALIRHYFEPELYPAPTRPMVLSEEEKEYVRALRAQKATQHAA